MSCFSLYSRSAKALKNLFTGSVVVPPLSRAGSLVFPCQLISYDNSGLGQDCSRGTQTGTLWTNSQGPQTDGQAMQTGPVKSSSSTSSSPMVTRRLVHWYTTGKQSGPAAGAVGERHVVHALLAQALVAGVHHGARDGRRRPAPRVLALHAAHHYRVAQW